MIGVVVAAQLGQKRDQSARKSLKTHLSLNVVGAALITCYGAPIASVQCAVIRCQRVVIRTEHPQILWPIVAPVAIDVVDMQRNLARHWISLGPPTQHAGAVL